MDVLGDVEDVREMPVDAVAFGLEGEDFPVAAGDTDEFVIDRTRVVAEREILAMIEAREGDGSTGVLLLGISEEVRGVAELGLHLLLAVAVVVIRDEGDDDPALVAAGDLECAAVVVELVR